ncbi:MAG: hypothetical protein U9Q69_00200 [Nanoarchaeota archaeon]|nr:hypothetical protein [Nanoarchaeota archaeon]
MAEVIYNHSGIPLLAFGESALITTIGGPKMTAGNSSVKKYNVKTSNSESKKTTKEKYEVMSWGDDNDFPENALTWIEKNTVLSSGLKYKLQMMMGQGIFPCKVISYESDGKENIEVVNEKNLIETLRSRMIRRYLSNTSRDVYKFGMAFPVLQFNSKGDKIVRIKPLNARSCRWEATTNGNLHNLILSDWREPKNFHSIKVLDIDDPDLHLMQLQKAGKTKNLNIVYPLDNYFGNNYYYQIPDWYVAYNAGWLGISEDVPKFIKKVYENQISWKWHVKIPYAYWEKRYPRNKYKNEEERKTLINADMKKIEDNLTGTSNAQKTIFSMFEINAHGKPEEQWIIEPLDNKYTSDQQMIESAVADSNILFSINVNPTIMGAGLPGSGPYAGKTGGSDIRESFLVNLALIWLDRQNILDPIELMLRYNGYSDVELRYRNTILTTLDTGAGTKKVIS